MALSTHSSHPRPYRRNLAGALLAIAAVLGFGLADPTPGSRGLAAEARPNVLVIETDDQTVESMRVMGNVNSMIGDQGARFRNSFVNFSLCCPSRATFLTGQYAHNHGVLGNWRAGWRLSPASQAGTKATTWPSGFRTRATTPP